MKGQDSQRITIALLFAVALHEIIAVFIPLPPVSPSKPALLAVQITTVHVTRIPSPTPSSVAVDALPLHVVAASPRRKLHHELSPVLTANVGAARVTMPSASAPIAPSASPFANGGAGAQTASGSSYGGEAASGSSGGNESGAERGGNDSGTAICGSVEFESSQEAVYNRRNGYFERTDVIATVYYADGTSQRVPLNWTWRYKDERDDPLKFGSTAPMLFQFPPPDQRSGEPAPVQYIISHTSPTGRTQLLRPCPAPTGARLAPKPRPSRLPR